MDSRVVQGTTGGAPQQHPAEGRGYRKSEATRGNEMAASTGRRNTGLLADWAAQPNDRNSGSVSPWPRVLSFPVRRPPEAAHERAQGAFSIDANHEARSQGGRLCNAHSQRRPPLVNGWGRPAVCPPDPANNVITAKGRVTPSSAAARGPTLGTPVHNALPRRQLPPALHRAVH